MCVLTYIPELGEFTKLFEELVVNELFEKAFRNRFPGVLYSRYLGEMLIYNTDRDESTFDERAGYDLLKELCIPGEIVSIGPGEAPLLFYNGRSRIYLTTEGKVLYNH